MRSRLSCYQEFPYMVFGGRPAKTSQIGQDYAWSRLEDKVVLVADEGIDDSRYPVDFVYFELLTHGYEVTFLEDVVVKVG